MSSSIKNLVIDVWAAARTNDIATVKSYLAHGGDVNARDEVRNAYAYI
jgi:hypothetical protein